MSIEDTKSVFGTWCGSLSSRFHRFKLRTCNHAAINLAATMIYIYHRRDGILDYIKARKEN
jgi:hypothetical protein